MTDPKGHWTDGGKVWEGRPELDIPLHKAIERILDDHSAWIARPNDEVTRSIAKLAIIAVHEIISEREALSATPSGERPSDADWKRAVECAFLCLHNVSITRAELDNAMQHAFGILALAQPASPLRGREIADRLQKIVSYQYIGEFARNAIWAAIAALSASPPEQPAAWECMGRKQSLPGECSWPDCGCDPHATKVIESLVEQGWTPPTDPQFAADAREQPAPDAVKMYADALDAKNARIAELEEALGKAVAQREPNEKELRDALEFGVWSLAGPTNSMEEKMVEEQVEEAWQDFKQQMVAMESPTVPDKEPELPAARPMGQS